jgi:hypothetical protein
MSTLPETRLNYRRQPDDPDELMVSPLSRKTGAFNSKVREVYGLALNDREYVGIRLDAQHIVEDVWYKRFAKDFEKAFGWKSSQEMEAIALHTE